MEVRKRGDLDSGVERREFIKATLGHPFDFVLGSLVGGGIAWTMVNI